MIENPCVDSFLFPVIEPYAQHLLNVDGNKSIYVEESGNPIGVPVVFVHGGPGGATNLHYRRFFDPKYYRIVLFDQRGCGKSTPKGDITNNTTKHLIQDMETIRTYLSIDRWGIFGGSWGATLSLLYSQVLPHRVLWMVLRGVFLFHKQELAWLYKDGASRIFPEAWEKFVMLIPEAERADLILAYYKHLKNNDDERLVQLAQSWMDWELTINHLLPLDPSIGVEKSTDDIIAFSRIESHYFAHNGFLESEHQLLENTNKLLNIPIMVVQGRYDIVCPFASAFQLSKQLNTVELVEVPLGGHSSFDINICEKLVYATEKMKRHVY